MAKKPTTKDCIKFVCDGLDTINETITSQKDLMHERNRLERARLEWEQETKDRVDISLKQYEEMKKQIETLKEQNEKYINIFERMGVEEWANDIEPSTIEVATMKDPIRLSTRVHIQFECKRYENYF